jgi:DNA-binding response OmpR family regulator
MTPFSAGCVSGPALVLVVEDEMMIAFGIEDCLGSLGCRTIGPFGEIDAALSASAQPLDFALLDVSVTGGTTYSLAKRLRARNVPFAFLSARSASDLPEEWSDVPVLQKPFSEMDLANLLATWSRGADAAKNTPCSLKPESRLVGQQ